MKTTDITGKDCSKPGKYLFNHKRSIVIKMTKNDENEDDNILKTIPKIIKLSGMQ